MITGKQGLSQELAKGAVEKEEVCGMVQRRDPVGYGENPQKLETC